MRNDCFLARFLREQGGATAIEYGLLAAGISMAIIAIVMQVGQNLNVNYFEKIDAGLQ